MYRNDEMMRRLDEFLLEVQNPRAISAARAEAWLRIRRMLT